LYFWSESSQSPEHTEEDIGMSHTNYSDGQFLEAATLDSGRVDQYVYECKAWKQLFKSAPFAHTKSAPIV
jgi:hypothetical protein